MSNYLKTLSLKDIKKLIGSDFYESMNLGFHLFKGIKSDEKLEDFYLASPSKSLRPSKTLKELGNYYNLLFNNLPNWKDFPKRERSLISSSSKMTAQSFAQNFKNTKSGNVYRVIPLYNTEIAIAPKEDIWYSFQKGLGLLALRGINITLVQFNLCLTDLFDQANVSAEKRNTWDGFIDGLQIITEHNEIKLTRISTDAENVLKSLKNNKDNIQKFIETCFDPKENGIELLNFNKGINKNNYPNNEIWTESDCLLIDQNIFANL